ncbi:Uncharacterised protein [Mycobacteroides abscessus subsp. abscessus]|nr:Uncharacterised protein [Mycobacteroides abscessus subsp. abscessus]
MRIWFRCAIEVGVGRAKAARCQRLERRLERGQSGDRQRTLRGAVVGDGPRDHFVFSGFSGQLEELFGQLPRAFHRLSATGGEEDTVQVARRVPGEAISELDRRLGGIRPQREIGEFFGLTGRGLRQFGTAMPGLHDE